MNTYFVYIISNDNNTVLYIGVTSDLIKRIYEHKNRVVDGFSKTYNLTKLVYYEIHNNISEAIKREKQMKKWKREYKDNIINEKNIYRRDLYEELL